ncbi:GNAT family N-acetyltransferase [Sphingoaurantiacus capsulatus]|uniref:GNAT family N-acetyltransferase n=1 Tax=Sphingoaurantiacus capsulatus TaxID=1771310 RepID=A0ABV7XBW1_9SPHN
MNARDTAAGTIRPCDPGDLPAILPIINAAAEAYRGVIPADRWHEPYMPAAELASEIADGVIFSGYVREGGLVGVMGVQRRRSVDLIRHAYVLPAWQGHGIGAALLRHLAASSERPILLGTWRAADWAVRFYERHGFSRVADGDVARLLRAYWNIPEAQVAASVVLASPPLIGDAVTRLIAEGAAA